MKKIAFILLFIVFNICSLYSEEYYKINDNSPKVLKDAGIEVSEEQKESINMILKITIIVFLFLDILLFI